MNWKMTKKIRRKERVNNALLFFVVFVLFLLVFGGMCVWAAVSINKERQGASSDGSSSSQTSEPETFTDSDIRSMLVVTLDGNDAQGFLILRADPMRSRVWAVSVPRETVADVETSEVRLYDLYASQGVAGVKTAIEKISGLKFDNYAVFTYENLEKLVDYYEGGVILDLPENVNYSDSNTVLKLESGLRTLRSSQVIGLLRYTGWSGGLAQKAGIQAQTAAAMVNQYMKESRENKSNADFNKFVNLASKSDTDILISDYIDTKQGLSYLRSRNDGSLCAALTVAGDYQGSGDAVRYYVSDSVASSLESLFGQTR